MGCCCCLPPAYSSWHEHPQPLSSGSHFTSQRREQQPSVCAVCGVYVHPTMLDSHREVCRLRQRQQQQQSDAGGVLRPPSQHMFDADALKKKLPTTDDAVLVSPDEYPVDALCVICLERLRCYAFLPCGHVVCCRDCAAQCDSCPVCRSERVGLCFVPPNTVADYHCKRCGCFIAPAIFDGHREVCALRLRQQAEQRDAERVHEESNMDGVVKWTGVDATTDAATTDGATDTNGGAALPQHRTQAPPAAQASTTPAPSAAAPSTFGPSGPMPMNLCVECLTSDRHLVISLPCGHRVMCVECAKTRRSCPVCYEDVTKVLVTYE